MSEFIFYVKQGINHITDFQGFDHMLFIVSLCAVYKAEQWKKILILVTAFTLGHSITLALTSLNVISVDKNLVEILIPITILITCLFNVIRREREKRGVSLNYFLALFFGLIHGMGFSTFFKAMMMGISDNIIFPLFAFNIGIGVRTADDFTGVYLTCVAVYQDPECKASRVDDIYQRSRSRNGCSNDY